MDEPKRSTNFSKSEERKLIQLALKKKHIIENKKTDRITTREKRIAWEKIAQQFNATSEDNIRTAKVLNDKYKNIKRLIRKRKFNNRNKVLTVTDYIEEMLEFLNEKDVGQNDADIYTNYLISTSIDEDSTTSQNDWEKYNIPVQQHSKPNDLLTSNARQRGKIPLTNSNLKKQLLKQQLEHARLEHEQKLENNRLEHEQRMIQAEEAHKLKIKILETDLMLKELQIPKHECEDV